MAIADQFQQFLGRAPSPAEAEYFQKFLTEGSIQEHEIGQILQSTPEFQRSQLTKDTAAFGQQLQANDQQILQRGAEVAGAQAQSRFAGIGRPNTSAMAAQVFGQTGQLAGGLAQQRQSALASFYGQGLQTGAGLQQQGGQAAQGRGYGIRDLREQRGYDESQAQYWYNRQQNDYNSAKNASSGWNAITPEFVTGGLFGIAGKVAGGFAGGYGEGLAKRKYDNSIPGASGSNQRGN